MKLTIWCKSFLSIYSLIPSITKGIDNLILYKGINSCQTSYITSNSTIKQAESIIGLSQKKVNLINLKVLTDETLLEMSKFNAKLLILRYIDGISIEKIVEVLKISRRSYYRKLNKALKEFEVILKDKVMKNKTIYTTFANESFFDDVFNRINSFNEKCKSENSLKVYAENIRNYIINGLRRSSF